MLRNTLPVIFATIFSLAPVPSFAAGEAESLFKYEVTACAESLVDFIRVSLKEALFFDAGSIGVDTSLDIDTTIEEEENVLFQTTQRKKRKISMTSPVSDPSSDECPEGSMFYRNSWTIDAAQSTPTLDCRTSEKARHIVVSYELDLTETTVIDDQAASQYSRDQG